MAVLARMLAVEEESWKGQGQCGMTEEPARSFYAAMLRRLARRAPRASCLPGMRTGMWVYFRRSWQAAYTVDNSSDITATRKIPV